MTFLAHAIAELGLVSATAMMFEARLMSKSNHELVGGMYAPLGLAVVSLVTEIRAKNTV